MRRFFARLLQVTRGRRIERELSREIEAHLALLQEEHEARGMSPNDARRAARVALGGIEQTKELHRDARGFTWAVTLVRDLSWGRPVSGGQPISSSRGLMKGAETAFCCLASLWLAAALCAAVRGAELYAEVYRPTGIPVRQTIVAARTVGGDIGLQGLLSLATALQLRDEFPGIPTAVFAVAAVPVRVGSGMHRTTVMFASGDIGTLGGISTTLGTGLPPRGAIAGQPTCLITPGFAARLGLAAQAMVGVAVSAEHGQCTIVGVTSRSAEYWRQDLGLITNLETEDAFPGKVLPRGPGYLIATLLAKPAGGRPELETRLRSARTGALSDVELHATTIPQFMTSDRARKSAALFGLTALVGAIACCAMVLAWCLTNAQLRTSQLSIHALQGARPMQYALRWLSTHAGRLLLLVGMAVPATLAVDSYIHSGRFVIERLMPVLVIAAGSVGVVASGILAGDLAVLSRFTSGARRFADNRNGVPRLWFVGMCITMPTLVIVAVGYVRSYVSVLTPPLGMTLESVIDVEVALDADGEEQTRQFVEAAARLPGVTGASAMEVGPVTDSGFTVSLTIRGGRRYLNGESSHVTPGRKLVAPGAFAVLGAPLLQGRDFDWRDTAQSGRVAVVNQAFAKTYFNGESPLDRQIKFGRANEVTEDWATIIGVVSDVRHEGYRGKVKPEVYLPLASERHGRSLHLLARRGTGSPKLTARMASAALAAVDPTARFVAMDTLQNVAARAVDSLWLTAVLSGWIALMTLLGVGVTMGLSSAAEVFARGKEMGIRIALGAEPFILLSRITLGRVLPVSVVATFAGVLVSIWASTVVRRLDVDFVPLTPWQVAGGLLAAPLLLTCGALVPVWRNMRRSPAGLLRDN
ncbi:MAG: ABC transporter permease [Vicinamibacterales bacterium]